MLFVVFRASLHFPGVRRIIFRLVWFVVCMMVTFSFTFLSSIWALNAKSKKWPSSSSTCDIVTYRAGAFAQLKTHIFKKTFFSQKNLIFQKNIIFFQKNIIFKKIWWQPWKWREARKTTKNTFLDFAFRA